MNARQRQVWTYAVRFSLALFVLSVAWTTFSDFDRVKQDPSSFLAALLFFTLIFLAVLGGMRLVFTRFVR